MTVGGTFYCQLWMGGLEPYMTESFVMSSFRQLGEKPLNVKVMRNKYSGEPAGYCFVHFQTDEEAVKVMHKLNGKMIPNSNPPVRFRLNNASTAGRVTSNEREFSLWVGDLSSDVDDYNLYKMFAYRYNSIRTAKVIKDNSGFSKGFGFIRFASEEEQKHCMQHMNGFKGLGTKALKISNAVPKTRPSSNIPSSMPGSSGVTTAATGQDYSNYYDPSYWQNTYSGWQSYYEEPAATSMQDTTEGTTVTQTPGAEPLNDMELIDHSMKLDMDVINRETLEQISVLWDDIESSKWLLPVDILECY